VIVNFISESVLLGFKAGAALAIISTQLPKLFGIHAPGANFIERMDAMVRHLGDTHSGVLMFGIAALVLLAIANRVLPGKPVALLLVILSIILLRFTGLKSLGLQQVGSLPSGLPMLSWPTVYPNELQEMVGLALACFLMGYIETVSAGRVMAEKHGYEIHPGRELLALASANAASAVAGGYVVSGGLSQTTVNDRSGARSPLALIIHALTLLLILLFLTGYMGEMPEVILSVIVIHAVSGLIRVKELRSLWYLSHTEFGIALAAIAGVLVLGILEGVLLASVISILLITKRAATPPVAVLGMIPGTEMFSDVARHPDNRAISGVLILRIESSVFYFNSRFIREEIDRQLSLCEPSASWLVLDLSASPYIDASGAKMLKKLADDLRARGTSLRVAEALSEARDMLRKAGIEAVTGHISRKVSLFEVVSGIGEGTPTG
jgi:MFS superfamily sulfate permease-like transporter